MRKVFNIVRVIALLVAYQVIAYVIVKVSLPCIQMFPPYRLMGEDTSKIIMHIFFGSIGLLLALYSYPVDLEKERQK